LILADTSVWIDFFSSRRGTAGEELARLIDASEPLVLSGLIATEILQGLNRDIEQSESFLASWDWIEPDGMKTYYRAAAIFRMACGKGVNLTTFDCLLAAIAIENGAQLFTLDRDFLRIARFTDLALYSG
jgi:predicted nucleic acid-binding protein